MQVFKLGHVEAERHSVHVAGQRGVGRVNVAVGVHPEHGGVGVGAEVTMDGGQANRVVTTQSQ